MSYQFDHRQLADEMEIYIFDEQIGAGLPIWLPNGVAIRDELEAYVKNLERIAGFNRVASPHLAKGVLYEQSGHLAKFKDDMYPPFQVDQNEYYLKPMNCPHHHKVFSSAPRSYRQLPLRIAEYGQVYRYENSGALRGLSRVRGLCQNDAHIYVDPQHALAEVRAVLEMHEECYRALGLKGYKYRLSKSDSKKEWLGGAELWRSCEEILRQALVEMKLPFFEADGEAAFYGPKIDVQMELASGSEESIASVQLDFISAERFNLSYVAESGANERPWIIHRAPLGSHERFVSLLIEYYEGQLPAWLSPIQLYIIPVSEDERAYANSLSQELLEKGIRAKVDLSQGSLSKRIHFAHRLRPFAKLILGKKEISSGELKVQRRDGESVVSRKQLGEEFIPLCRAPSRER